MNFTYSKLDYLLDKKGLSYHSLFKKRVISDNASRNLQAGKPVTIDHLASICNYLHVSIDQVVDVVPDSDN